MADHPTQTRTQPRPPKLVALDGRTGEGGGQLCRIAVSLAALTGTPLKIDHVRGNRHVCRCARVKPAYANIHHRPGTRGGGERFVPSS